MLTDSEIYQLQSTEADYAHYIPVTDLSVPAIMAVADQVRIYPYTASHYIAIVLIRSKSVCADNC